MFALTKKIGGVTLLVASSQPQGWNRYSYVMNNPINKTDPTGRCVWDLCIGEAALVLAGSTAILTTAVVYLNHPNPYSPGRTNGQVIVGTIATAATFVKITGQTLMEKHKPVVQAGPSIILSDKVRQLGDRAKQGSIDGAIDQLDSLQERKKRIRQGTGSGIVDGTDKSEQRVRDALNRIEDLKDATEDEEEKPEVKKTPADEKSPPQ
jgi:hypothetical protein